MSAASEQREPSVRSSSPRLALVTGASSGIGAATALALAEAGWSLLLHGRDRGRSEASERAVARALSVDATVGVRVADLTQEGAVEELVAAVGERELHALVHAAGMVRLGSVADSPVGVLDEHLALNLRAPYALTHALLPALRSGHGHVVMVNSTAGKRANARWSSYAASKFALRALADSLRQEEPELRVTSVYPGRTATPMQATVHESEGIEYDPERFVRPEAVAAQIVALLELPRPSLVHEVTVGPG